MGLERPTVWIILAIVALALFGYKRLPDASRSVGRSLRIFKSELKGMSADDEAREAAKAAGAAPAADVRADVPVVTPTPIAPAAESTPPTIEGNSTAPRAD